MTTHFRSSRLLIGVALLFVISSVANAQLPTGTLKRFVLKSTVLGEDRVILVRTPIGYENSKMRYPIVYMTDGDVHMAHTSSTIEYLFRNGRIPDLILVGVTNTDRTRDLTPAKSIDRNAAGELLNPTAGGADNFLKFFETELIPEIEKEYRVLPYRIFAGHSFGGLFAIHTMITKPKLFNAYIAVSPALQWADFEALKRAEEFLKNQKELKLTLYMSVGHEPGGLGDSVDRFRDFLAKTPIKGFEWQFERLDDEDHGSVVLRSHYFGLRKVYEGWRGPRAESGALIGGLKDADAHYAKLSERLGYTIPVPEALINQLGYQFLNGGKPEEAIATFKANVERYPDSANVYDSLGEAYERGGQIEIAEPLYEKARTLSVQNNDPNVAIYKTNYERAHAKLKEKQATKKQ